MKDIALVWQRLAGRTYSAVNTGPNASNLKDPQCPAVEECSLKSPTNVAHRFIKRGINVHTSVLTTAVLGILGIASGLFILLVQPYDVLFRLKVVFSEGGEIFELWRAPPVELYLKVYLFNVTNREAFLRGEEKLKVEEVGPYVYRELLSHENVTFNDNGTVSAAPSHPLVWMPELSEGNLEEDQFILPNIALLSIAHVVSQSSYFTRLGLNLLIRQMDSQPLVQMSAREFMFGYESSLLTLGNKFLPNWIYFDKLGLIDRMYDFDGDFETVYTGEDDVRKTGLIDTYIGSTSIPQWKGVCGNVQNASDGTKFASYIQPNDTLLFFRKSMCRSQELIRVKETVSNGLKAYEYAFTENANDNGHYNPENLCFCRKDQCLPPGLLDVTECYYGFPIALSYPHFLGSHPTVGQSVEGSKPDPKKHSSYFIVQPDSGLPLDLAVRYQINMALGNIGSIAHTEKFANMVLPLLWTESRMYSLPDFLKARFNLYLNVLPTVQTCAMYLLLAMGALFVVYATFKCSRTRRKWARRNQGKTVPWIDRDGDSMHEDDPLEGKHKMERRLSTYIQVERKHSMTSKELEVYYNSLITPLNQDISFQEFQELKEDMV